jgi:hypothetical protein
MTDAIATGEQQAADFKASAAVAVYVSPFVPNAENRFWTCSRNRCAQDATLLLMIERKDGERTQRRWHRACSPKHLADLTRAAYSATL